MIIVITSTTCSTCQRREVDKILLVVDYLENILPPLTTVSNEFTRIGTCPLMFICTGYITDTMWTKFAKKKKLLIAMKWQNSSLISLHVFNGSVVDTEIRIMNISGNSLCWRTAYLDSNSPQRLIKDPAFSYAHKTFEKKLDPDGRGSKVQEPQVIMVEPKSWRPRGMTVRLVGNKMMTNRERIIAL